MAGARGVDKGQAPPAPEEGGVWPLSTPVGPPPTPGMQDPPPGTTRARLFERLSALIQMIKNGDGRYDRRDPWAR